MPNPIFEEQPANADEGMASNDEEGVGAGQEDSGEAGQSGQDEGVGDKDAEGSEDEGEGGIDESQPVDVEEGASEESGNDGSDHGSEGNDASTEGEFETGSTEEESGGESSATGEESDGGGTEEESEEGETDEGGGETLFCDNPDDDLVACYQFDSVEVGKDGGKFYEDESGNENHAYSKNPSVVEIEERLGHPSVQNSEVTVPSSSAWKFDGELTIEMWVYLEEDVSDDKERYLLFKEGVFELGYAGDKEIFCGNDKIDPMSATVNGGLFGGWMHVACVFDGENVGIVVGGTALDKAKDRPIGEISDTVMAIGNNSEFSRGARGYIDSLRIWQRNLSVDELCEASGRNDC